MKRKKRFGRRGSLLISVLVCLGIATSITLTGIHSSLRARRQVARELQMEQTRWLVDAGLNRGLIRIRSNADYAGEIWEVTPPLNAHTQATIAVTREASELPDGKTRLTATATIRSLDPISQVTQRTRSIVVETD